MVVLPRSRRKARVERHAAQHVGRRAYARCSAQWLRRPRLRPASRRQDHAVRVLDPAMRDRVAAERGHEAFHIHAARYAPSLPRRFSSNTPGRPPRRQFARLLRVDSRGRLIIPGLRLRSAMMARAAVRPGPAASGGRLRTAAATG